MPMPHQLLKEPCHLKTDTGTDKRAFRYWLALAFWGSFSTTVSSPSILASPHPSGCLLRMIIGVAYFFQDQIQLNMNIMISLG